MSETLPQEHEAPVEFHPANVSQPNSRENPMTARELIERSLAGQLRRATNISFEVEGKVISAKNYDDLQKKFAEDSERPESIN